MTKRLKGLWLMWRRSKSLLENSKFSATKVKRKVWGLSTKHLFGSIMLFLDLISSSNIWRGKGKNWTLPRSSTPGRSLVSTGTQSHSNILKANTAMFSKESYQIWLSIPTSSQLELWWKGTKNLCLWSLLMDKKTGEMPTINTTTSLSKWNKMKIVRKRVTKINISFLLRNLNFDNLCF